MNLVARYNSTLYQMGLDIINEHHMVVAYDMNMDARTGYGMFVQVGERVNNDTGLQDTYYAHRINLYCSEYQIVMKEFGAQMHDCNMYFRFRVDALEALCEVALRSAILRLRGGRRR